MQTLTEERAFLIKLRKYIRAENENARKEIKNINGRIDTNNAMVKEIEDRVKQIDRI